MANKRALSDHVYQQMKDWLFQSRYGRAGRLPVEDIAQELGVSRQPVMDALKRLEHEGFVEIVPQVGCKVREYTLEETADFFLLFADAEGIVAELAARRATSDDVIKLQVISGQIEQLKLATTGSKEDRAQIYRSLNRMFHTEIRRIARSSALTEIVESLGDRSDFFIATSGRPMFAETLSMAHQEHSDVIAAIATHDTSAARRAMTTHVLATSTRLQQFLQTPSVSTPEITR